MFSYARWLLGKWERCWGWIGTKGRLSTNGKTGANRGASVCLMHTVIMPPAPRPSHVGAIVCPPAHLPNMIATDLLSHLSLLSRVPLQVRVQFPAWKELKMSTWEMKGDPLVRAMVSWLKDKWWRETRRESVRTGSSNELWHERR